MDHKTMKLGTSLVSLAYSIISRESRKHRRVNQIIKHCPMNLGALALSPSESQKPSKPQWSPARNKVAGPCCPEPVREEEEVFSHRRFQVTTNRREKSTYTKALFRSNYRHSSGTTTTWAQHNQIIGLADFQFSPPTGKSNIFNDRHAHTFLFSLKITRWAVTYLLKDLGWAQLVQL